MSTPFYETRPERAQCGESRSQRARAEFRGCQVIRHVKSIDEQVKKVSSVFLPTNLLRVTVQSRSCLM